MFFGIVLTAQEYSTKIEGRIYSKDGDVASTHILNISLKRFTIADADGFFSIPVRVNDTLVFSAVQFKRKQLVINKENIRQRTLVVPLEDELTQLNEVVVTPHNLTGELDRDVKRIKIEPVVTSSTLGLPNAGIEVMTQSERLLIEADRGKYVRLATIEDQGKLIAALGYLTPTIIINTHKIMNRASGRTKSFEEMVARDENIELEKEIITKFTKKTISEDFDIPETNIDGFLTYCMSQDDFSELSNAGNTMEIWEYLKARSIEFKNTDFLKE